MAWSKESRQSRGYGAPWDKIRLRILKRDCGVCQCSHCKAAGAVRIATEVDHIVSKKKAERLGWTQEQIDAENNLQSINSDCHKRKTQEEMGNGRRREIGPDGWPTE